MGQGTAPALGPALCTHFIRHRRKLVQEVIDFQTCRNPVLPDGLLDGGVYKEVVGIERGTAIATAAVHRGVGRNEGLQYRYGVPGVEAVVVVEGFQCLEVLHLSFGMAPLDVARDAYGEHILVVLQLEALMQGGGVHGIAVALCVPLQHRMVDGMVETGIGACTPAPSFLPVQCAGEGELPVCGVRTFHIHGFVGVHARLRVVARRLRHIAVMVVKRGAQIPLLLAGAVVVHEGQAYVCGGPALQPGISQPYHQGLAVVAIVNAVLQISRVALVFGIGAESSFPLKPYLLEGGSGSYIHPVLAYKRVDNAPLVVHRLADDRQFESNLPPVILIGHEGIQLITLFLT